MRVSESKLVGVLTAYGFLLRLVNLDKTAVVDEAITIAFSWDYGPVALLTQLPLQQPHPPLYYLFVDVITSLGGGIVAVRGLSVVAGTAAIPLLFLLGRQLFDSRTGFFAAAIVTISPFHISLSQLARMYALLGTLTIVSWWCLLKAIESDLKPAFVTGFVLSTGAVVFTHYFGILTLVSQVLWLLVAKPDAVRDSRSTGVAMGALGMTLTPVPAWLGYHALRETGAGGEATAVVGLPTPDLLILTRMAASTLLGWNIASTLSYIPGILEFMGAGALILVVGGIRSRGFPRVTISHPVALWALVPIVIALTVSVTVKPVLRPRYVIGSILALYLVLGVLSKMAWESGDRTVVVLLLVTMVAVAPAQATTDRNAGWGDATSALEDQAEQEDKLVVVGSFAREQQYRLRDVDVQVAGGGVVPAKVDASVQRDTTVWVLRSWSQQWTWDKQLSPDDIGLPQHQIESVEQFGNVKLYKLEPADRCEAHRKLEAGR